MGRQFLGKMGELIMKNIRSKSFLVAASLLLVAAVGLAIRIDFATNTAVANSKLQNPVRSPDRTSKLAEKIEGFQVLRTPGQIVAPRSLEEMVDKADLIVIGKPSQSIAQSTAIVKRDREGYLSSAISQTEFKVSRVLKGTLDSKKILVGQQAAIVKEEGDIEPKMRVLHEYQPLVKNAKYILFLRKGLDGSPSYFPSGVYFGKINIDGSDRGEKKANYGQEVKAIQAAALKRYQAEVNQPD